MLDGGAIEFVGVVDKLVGEEHRGVLDHLGHLRVEEAGIIDDRLPVLERRAAHAPSRLGSKPSSFSIAFMPKKPVSPWLRIPIFLPLRSAIDVNGLSGFTPTST